MTRRDSDCVLYVLSFCTATADFQKEINEQQHVTATPNEYLQMQQASDALIQRKHHD